MEQSCWKHHWNPQRTVSIKDVVALLTQIALKGTKRIYNIASGRNVSNAELTNQIARATNCVLKVEPNAPTVIFPEIDISRVREDFNFAPANILDDLASLIDSYRRTMEPQL
jgi:dTDP-4-dehydrorhamnose reductase